MMYWIKSKWEYNVFRTSLDTFLSLVVIEDAHWLAVQSHAYGQAMLIFY